MRIGPVSVLSDRRQTCAVALHRDLARCGRFALDPMQAPALVRSHRGAFMNKRFAIIALTVVALTGCQPAAGTRPPSGVLQEDLGRLRAERDAGQISYTEWAERTSAAARVNVALTPIQEQAIAYRLQLARRVDAGELTPAQFDRESARTLRRLKASNEGV